MKNKRICLVSPAHISCNPRLLKEANTLHDAGFQVRVIVGNHASEAYEFDEAILANVAWKWSKVHPGARFTYLRRKLLQRTARHFLSLSKKFDTNLATWAHSPLSKTLAQVASNEPADLYIAHNLAALPAAAIATQKYKAKLGFDAEDFHVGELIERPENLLEINIRDHLERTFLPRCDYLTASSPLIAQAYAERYNVEMTSILNVFPLCELPRASGHWRDNKTDSSFSIYWFSQTIGPGRGLEEIVQVIAKMQNHVKLFLRGSKIPAPGFVRQLEQLAEKLGISESIHFLPLAHSNSMAELAANYDLGLSLENNEPQNRALCLTNKIFTYLLAGIPVVMSSTPAQIELAKQLGEAAILIDLYNPDITAKQLDDFLSNSNRFRASRNAALRLAKEHYNWDIEKHQFLKIIEKILK